MTTVVTTTGTNSLVDPQAQRLVDFLRDVGLPHDNIMADPSDRTGAIVHGLRQLRQSKRKRKCTQKSRDTRRCSVRTANSLDMNQKSEQPKICADPFLSACICVYAYFAASNHDETLFATALPETGSAP